MSCTWILATVLVLNVLAWLLIVALWKATTD